MSRRPPLPVNVCGPPDASGLARRRRPNGERLRNRASRSVRFQPGRSVSGRDEQRQPPRGRISSRAATAMNVVFATIFATSAVAGILGLAWLENYLQHRLRQRRIHRRRRIREQILARREAGKVQTPH